MYLSKLIIDRKNPSARQAMINCQDMHRNLMRAFPEVPKDIAFRSENAILYRMQAKGSQFAIYVTSTIKPDWAKIRNLGYNEAGFKDISKISEKFEPGRMFNFDIVLSPNKKMINPDGKNSRRVYIANREARQEWLERKAEQSGFKIEWIREESTTEILGNHCKEKGGRMTILSTQYKGLLQVVDQEKFTFAFRGGIGPGKAYGLGMLMLFVK